MWHISTSPPFWQRDGINLTAAQWAGLDVPFHLPSFGHPSSVSGALDPLLVVSFKNLLLWTWSLLRPSCPRCKFNYCLNTSYHISIYNMYFYYLFIYLFIYYNTVYILLSFLAMFGIITYKDNNTKKKKNICLIRITVSVGKPVLLC